MTAALEGGEWPAARPGCSLRPGKTRYPFYRRLGWPQSQSGRAENLVPTGIRSRTVQPVVSRYTDWATRPTYVLRIYCDILFTGFQNKNCIRISHITRACSMLQRFHTPWSLSPRTCCRVVWYISVNASTNRLRLPTILKTESSGSPKPWYLSTRPDGVIYHKAVTLIVRMSVSG